MTGHYMFPFHHPPSLNSLNMDICRIGWSELDPRYKGLYTFYTYTLDEQLRDCKV